MRLAPALLAALALTSRAAAAQDFPSTPPPDLAARPVALPKAETRALPNGLRVIVVPSRHVPLVTIRLGVLAGNVYNPASSQGLAAAAASQMTAGTNRYTSLQLRQAAENLGGTVSATADADYAVLAGTALAENAPALLDLMADVLLHPAYPAAELATYKSLTEQSLIVQRQNPGFLAREQAAKALFGDSAYGRTAPSVEAIRALNERELKEFHDQRWRPEGAALVVVGDVRPQMVFRKVQLLLGAWAAGAAAPAPAAPQLWKGPRRLFLINRPGSVQSNIIVASPAPRQGDPASYALAVANTLLGSGGSSRLFSTVREKLGYAYSVSSAVSALGLAGEIDATAETRTDVTAPAIKEMLKQMEGMRTQTVSAPDLRAAQNLVNGRFVQSLTSQARLADRFLAMAMYHLPPNYLATYRDRINAVTPQMVQEIATRYIRPDTAAIIVVGDAGKLRAPMAEIAPVEEVK